MENKINSKEGRDEKGRFKKGHTDLVGKEGHIKAGVSIGKFWEEHPEKKEKLKSKEPPNKIKINPLEIIEKYINENMSLEKIARIYGTSSQPIYRILKENNINLRPKGYQNGHKQVNSGRTHFKKGCEPWNKNKIGLMPEPHNKLYLDSKKIIKMYTDEKMSILKISKEMGCSQRTIGRIFKINNITTINKTKFKKGMIPWSASQKGVRLCPIEKYRRGENHPCFNNWSSFEPYPPSFNDNFKNIIKLRDNFCCLNCGVSEQKHILINGWKLSIHHIDYKKENTYLQNCCTLCLSCNSKANTNREYWTKLFQDKLSKSYNYKYSENEEITLEIKR